MTEKELEKRRWGEMENKKKEFFFFVSPIRRFVVFGAK